jgi:hypothetical protein
VCKGEGGSCDVVRQSDQVDRGKPGSFHNRGITRFISCADTVSEAV